MSWLDKYFANKNYALVKDETKKLPPRPALKFNSPFFVLSDNSNDEVTVIDIDESALGIIGGGGESEEVIPVGAGTGLGGDFVIGDWVCSANDPSDSLKSNLAISANLAPVGGIVRGVLLEGGPVGFPRQMASNGDRIANSVCGLGAGADGPVILNPTTGRAERKAYPAPLDLVLGSCDQQGNIDIGIVHPGVGTWIDNLSFVSVLDYGADATGVADCSAAHDAAHAIALARGMKLLYGAGTYKLSISKTITASLEILGTIDGMSTNALSKVFQVDATPITYVDTTTDANDADAADFLPFPASEIVGDYCLFGYSTPFGRLTFDNSGGTAGVGGLVTWEYWDGARWMLLDHVVDGTSSFTAAAGNGKTVTYRIPPSWQARVINGSSSLFWVRCRILAVYSTNPVLNRVYVGNATTLTIAGPLEARAKKIFGDNLNVAFTTAAKIDDLIPEWFGSVGDGTADDTVAVQRCLWASRGSESFRFRRKHKITSELKLWCGLGAMGLKAFDNCFNFDGGFSSGSLNQHAGFLFSFSDYKGTCEIDYVGNGSGSTTFTANASLDEITFASGIAGEFAKVRFTTSGTLPAPLALATDYWLIEVGEGVCQVALTLANAIIGTAINITDAGTGTHTITVQASGDIMMRLKNPTGITPNTPNAVGSPIRIYACTTKENIVDTTVSKIKRVGADTFMWVYNPTAGAAAPDFGLGGSAGNGKVRFRIERKGWDIRARETSIRGGVITMGNGFQLSGGLVSICESPEPDTALSTASTVTSIEWEKVTLGIYSNQSTCRALVRLADTIIPAKNSSLGRFIVNGDGVPQVYHPFQCDYNYFHRCKFMSLFGSKTCGIIGIGRGGQSERNMIVACEMNLLRNGVFAPRSKTGGTNYIHFDFFDVELAHYRDSFADFSSQANDITLSRCKGEFGSGRILNDRSGSSNRVVRCEGLEVITYHSDSAWPNNGHPLQRMIETNTAGVVEVNACSFSFGGDGSKTKILQTNHNQGASNQFPSVVLEKNRVVGAPDVQGIVGFTDARRMGPHAFDGTETLDVKVNGHATPITVTFSSSNFNTAFALLNSGYLVDLNEVHDYEIAMLIEYWCRITPLTSVSNAANQIVFPAAFSCPNAKVRFTSTGTLPAPLLAGVDYYLIEDSAGTCRVAASRALAVAGTHIDLTTDGTGTITITLQGCPNVRGYGSEESSLLRLLCDDRPGASIQVTGGTANVQLDFNTAGIGTRSAKSQQTIETGGMMLEPSVVSSSDEVSVVFKGNRFCDNAQTPLHYDNFEKTYNASSTDRPRFSYGSVAGLARDGAALLPKNFFDQITKTGTTGASTFTVTDIPNDIITFTAGAFGKLTKVQFTNAGGALPAGLNLATDYWLIELTSTTAKVALSLANAKAGTPVNITDAGTGTHTMTVQPGGSTFTWTFARTEDDALMMFEPPGVVSDTGTPAANSDKARLIHQTTTYAVWTTTDPGSGNTVLWHVEMRR